LASNSLLEALVYAQRAHGAALEGFDPAEALPRVRLWQEPGGSGAPDPVVLEHDWDEARRVMWDYVGIVRSDARLDIAAQRMQNLAGTVDIVYRRSRVTQDLLELRNIIAVGQMVIESARRRKESRGLHYNESHPARDDARFQHDTVLELKGA
ncbi:MAG TPA: L-aspartate oxidase, partial [Candidatus Krumholzibacteria bacterium]|nr:L-aspartate oxidase [Candidatus Krumholzibacteria bacterium]